MGRTRIALVAAAAALACLGLAVLPAAASGPAASLTVRISMLPGNVPGDVNATHSDLALR